MIVGEPHFVLRYPVTFDEAEVMQLRAVGALQASCTIPCICYLTARELHAMCRKFGWPVPQGLADVVQVGDM
jgi:hypothetical protein